MLQSPQDRSRRRRQHVESATGEHSGPERWESEVGVRLGHAVPIPREKAVSRAYAGGEHDGLQRACLTLVSMAMIVEVGCTRGVESSGASAAHHVESTKTSGTLREL